MLFKVSALASSTNSVGLVLQLFSPVLVEQRVCRLGLVLQSLQVNAVSLILHSLLLKVPSPGQVQGRRPAADAATEDVSVQGGGVRAVTGLEDTVSMET